MVLTDCLNQRRSLEFVSRRMVCGRPFRILSVIDDFFRDYRARVADVLLSAARVARELAILIGLHSKLSTMVSYNGMELTSPDILRWS